jgi:hypothetical protein
MSARSDAEVRMMMDRLNLTVAELSDDVGSCRERPDLR